MMVNPLVVTLSSIGQRSTTHKEELREGLKKLKEMETPSLSMVITTVHRACNWLRMLTTCAFSAAYLVTFSTISGS